MLFDSFREYRRTVQSYLKHDRQGSSLFQVRYDIEQELKTMRKGLLSKKIQSNLAFRRITHYEELLRAPKGLPRRRYRKY